LPGIAMMAFVYSRRQWAELARDERASREVRSVATLEPDVLALCERRGWAPIDLSDALPLSEMAAHQDAAARACDALGERLAPRLRPEHQGLARHIAHDLLYPVAYALHLRAMMDRVLDRYRPADACVFGDTAQAFFWDPVEMPPDLANAVTMAAIAARGIRQLALRAPMPTSHEAPANRRHIWSPACRVPAAPGARLALLQGIGWEEAAELLRPERQAAAARPVHAISMAWLNYADMELPYSEAQFQAAAESAVREVGETHARLRETVGAPSLRFLWDAWAGMMRECVRAFEIGKWLVSALRPSSVVLGYDIRGPERCMAEGILAAGGVPVSILHGGINGMENEGPRHRGAPGHLAVWSERDVSLLRPFRAEGFRIEAVGSLRADVRALAERARAPRGHEPTAATAKPRVLFLTCRVGGLYTFTLSFARHVAVWRELQHLCARRSEWAFVLKRHPRYDQSALYGIDAQPPPANLVEARGPLGDALDSADIVVLPNVETTAALEAMLCGLPVILLDAASRADQPTWLRTCGITIVKDVDSLETELERLLSDPAARAAYGRECARIAREALPNVGEVAAEAFCRFLDRVEVESGARRSEGDLDAAAVWMLNIARWVDERMMHNPRAQPPRAPAVRALRSAQARVNWPHFGRQIINRIVWYPWSPCVGSPSDAVWRAYCALPRAARPPFRWVRPYLLEALRRECADPHLPPRFRLGRRFAAATLSPRSLRDPSFRVKHAQS
jgi:hypothetical protein